MLIGEYPCAIDNIKGRLNFPAKLREDMGERFILCRGNGDRCINAYSLEAFEQLSEKLRQYPVSQAKMLRRYLFSGAAEAEPDKQGRIVIPQNLREFAGLTKDVVVIGADDHCEIWDKAEWDFLNARMEVSAVNQLMTDIGF
ncbi:MAG: division/cell wall cluster transcriptional repressor MraZ [Oscillospiraceae bacterium]|nr:division/cell wall cluster transcriptional repressor MraZ [Oscillospiraceae bacterium]